MENAPAASVGRKQLVAVCILVFIAAFAVYANTLLGDFIWDDEYLILNNSQIKSFSHIQNIFKTYVGYGSENINNFYRPIQEISNMCDYFLWGEYPFGFHLTNVILHSFVAVMVFIFLYSITKDLFIAAIAALFHAVHPVHTEAIAYIAGRADSLYSVFMLLSLVMFIGFINSARSGKAVPGKYLFSIIFFILSLLSKEIIITMPLLIFLYMFYFLKGTEDNGLYKRFKWYWVPYAAIGAVYAYMRVTVLDFSNIAPKSLFFKFPIAHRLLTFFRTVITYFKLMIFPADLHMERTIPITKTIADPASLVALVVIAAIGWAAFVTYKKNRLVSFGIVWFFANLLPVSNIVPINSFLAEHWIYMASVGLFLIFASGVAWVYRGGIKAGIYRKAYIVALAVLLAVYARATVIRNMDWKDEITFFQSTLKYHPRNARLYLNLGNTYYEKGEVDKAIEQYTKSIEINSKYAVAYGNIGSAYLNKRDVKKAEEYLKAAVEMKPNYPIAHYNLGIVYFQEKKYKEAIAELTTATNQLPQLYQAWNMLGRTYLKLRRVPEARTVFQKSLSILPSQTDIQKALQKIQ